MKALSAVALLQVLGVSLAGKVLPKADSAPPSNIIFFKVRHSGNQNITKDMVLGQCRDIFDASKISSSKCSESIQLRKRPSVYHPSFRLAHPLFTVSHSYLAPQGKNSMLNSIRMQGLMLVIEFEVQRVDQYGPMYS
jgi:hypothetical protein